MRNIERKKKLSNIILEYIINNFKDFLLITIIIFIGIALGVNYVNNIKNENQIQIKNYIENYVNVLKDGNTKIDRTELLKQNLVQNLGLVAIMWFVGSTVIGMPIVLGILIYKGFSLGYAISSVIACLGIKEGTIFTLSLIFLQNLIFIPSLIFLGVSAMKLYKAILKDHRKENIKFEIYKHSMISLILAIIFGIGTIIEAYLSTSIFLLTIPIYK